MNDDPALEQRFVDRAKALSNVAEVFRCSEVTMLVCEMVAFGVRAEPKIFEAAYGDPSGQKYWEANLSEPIRVYTSPMCYQFTWQNEPNRWRWQWLRSFGLFEMS